MSWRPLFHLDDDLATDSDFQVSRRKPQAGLGGFEARWSGRVTSIAC
jgi:hypothetical protein